MGATALVAFNVPVQSRLPFLPSAVAVALVLNATLVAKILVQIREGMALFLLIPAIFIGISGRRRLYPVAFLLTLVAFNVHSGVLVICLCVIASFGVPRAANHLLAKPSVMNGGAALSLAIGLGAAAYLTRHADIAYRLFADYIIENREAAPEIGAAKFIYWILVGLLAIYIRNLCNSIAKDDNNLFASNCALLVGNVAVPFLYAIPALLVAVNFPELAIVSLLIRIFLTAISAGTLLIIRAGRADWFLMGASALMIVDQFRTLLAALRA